VLDTVGHPTNQILKVFLIPRTNHIVDVVAHEGPVTSPRLDTEAAPQIEHVVRDFGRPARFEYDAATEILSPVLRLEPVLGNYYRSRCLLLSSNIVLNFNLFLDHKVRQHVVEIVNLHEIQFFANDAGDHGLAAVFDHGKSLVHGI
jgi:hypothetical protein